VAENELIFEGPLYGKENLLQFIPQRDPMVMMDDLLYWDHSKTTSGLTISEDNLLSTSQEFTEPGVIENFAQTMALRIGYHYYLLKKPAPVGYIGSFKKFNLSRLPKTGERIETTIEVIQELFGVTMAKGEMILNNETIASIEMKTVVAKEE
jgi:predicted hotdog family 3-hydroxylacyl-ACP dehydratase